MKIPIGRIPKFLSASSPKGLQRLMLITQVKLGYGVNWFDISKDGSKWIVWYIDNNDIDMHNVEERIGGDSISE